MVAENIKILYERIKDVCNACNRSFKEINLVAVSKTFSVGKIKEALDAGQLEFGENYVQEMQKKRDTLINQPIRWHFIGHLQSNKVKYISEYVHLIHSVDSVGLGKEINKRAEKLNRVQEILVEVNTTNEATKFGVTPEKTISLIKELSNLRNLKVLGLMTLGPFSENQNDSRLSFRQLFELKKNIEREGVETVEMKHLSMGMTHDFEIAIEEGATIIRIGTAIFGNRSVK